MNKSFVKNVLAALFGICLLIVVYGWVSLIVDVSMNDNLISYLSVEGQFQLIHFEKLASIGMIVIVAAAVACSIYAFFAKSKIVNILTAVTLLAATISGIAVAVQIKKIASVYDAEIFVIATAYIQEIMQIIIPLALMSIYFIYNSVKLFITKKGGKENESV